MYGSGAQIGMIADIMRVVQTVTQSDQIMVWLLCYVVAVREIERLTFALRQECIVVLGLAIFTPAFD